MAKRATINRGIHYPVVAKRAKLSAKKKQLFLYLANPKQFKTETGGYIDFNKKDAQRVWMEFAGRSIKDYDIVELPEQKDWETMFHTHQDASPQAIIPSDIDLYGFLKDNQDVNLIFTPTGAVLVINRSKKPKGISDKDLKKKIKERLAVVDKDIQSSNKLTQKEFYSKVLNSLRENFADMGLRFDLTTADKLSIPVKVREPRKNYGQGPILYSKPVDIETMSDEEIERIKSIMFPKYEPRKVMGRKPVSISQERNREIESLKESLEVAREKDDKPAIQYLSEQLGDI